MGYTRAAIVATTYNRNDLTIWKNYCTEIHDELVASGLSQTGDTGQLSITGVGSLPADGTYAGYRIYVLDDDMTADGYAIYFKIEFGCALEGITSSNTSAANCLRIRVTVGAKTDGAGNLFAQNGTTTINPAITWGNPQTTTLGTTDAVTGSPPAANLYVCHNPDKGFYGFVFGCNGRGSITSSTSAQFNGSSLTIFVQRSLDADGAPNNVGFTVYMNRLGSVTISSGGTRWPSVSNVTPIYMVTQGFRYINASTQSTIYANPHPGGLDSTPINGQIQTGPVYQYTDKMSVNPNMVTYRTMDMAEGTQFKIETSPAVFTNFIALGPGTGMQPDQFAQQMSFAMLFE